MTLRNKWGRSIDDFDTMLIRYGVQHYIVEHGTKGIDWDSTPSINILCPYSVYTEDGYPVLGFVPEQKIGQAWYLTTTEFVDDNKRSENEVGRTERKEGS